MALPKVYIETSIPSFYHDSRTHAEAVARRNWTQHWWDFKRDGYELHTSEAVLEELENGVYPHKALALELISDLPVLQIAPVIRETVKTYIAQLVMPANPTGDAIHLALASHHQCDFLLTWNCSHLANANKFRHIRHVNSSLGLHVPALVTPLELLGVEP